MKRVTIKDVAVRAGVSFATVSRVLDDRPEISDATKARVRAACAEMGYVPNKAARGLVMKNTKTIGLIVPDISNPYFSGLGLSVEMRARENGYRVLLCNSLREEAREILVLDSLLSQQIDGLIIAPVSPGSQRKLEHALGSTPRVYLGNNHDDQCSYVVVDNKRGAYEATRYLLCLGHRDIAFLGGREGSRTRHFRIAGFRKAMEEAGLSGREYPSPAEGDSYQHNHARALQLFREGPLPHAIFAYSDRIALSVLQAAEECGVRIPEDVSLLGFDNIDFAGLPRINLTTVSQHKAELGRRAVDHLFAQIAGDMTPVADILEPELIIRDTCRRR